MGSFDPQALTSLTIRGAAYSLAPVMFRSTGSYEPDPPLASKSGGKSRLFRSTGSYEPDHAFSPVKPIASSFDPQALTSLTGKKQEEKTAEPEFRSTGSYEPDHYHIIPAPSLYQFRSTGSYEPDLSIPFLWVFSKMFRSTGSYEPDRLSAALY